ncbi:MAG: hypothetical protein NTW95_11935 [Candidatus Aminicenantes bacterium]|nr:hypothetical protein [Candidatus Aminicenantes bacterium]
MVEKFPTNVNPRLKKRGEISLHTFLLGWCFASLTSVSEAAGRTSIVFAVWLTGHCEGADDQQRDPFLVFLDHRCQPSL